MWLLRRLLKYACTQGLAQLAAYVLPVALRGPGGVPALLAACAAASPAGWSLLHLAVASGSQATVEVLHQEPRCLYRQLMCHEHAFPQHGQCKRHGTFTMSVWSISSRNPYPLAQQVLLELGEEQGHIWDGAAGGPSGLSPLHIAAVRPGGGDLALLLANRSAPGAHHLPGAGFVSRPPVCCSDSKLRCGSTEPLASGTTP